ncbi:MAG: hypothetical protein V4598_06065 [Bdellovibrionota bacterium]
MKLVSVMILGSVIVSCGSLKPPEIKGEAYSAQIPSVVQKLSARATITGMPIPVETIVIAPMTYTYDFNENVGGTSQYTSYTPMWQAKRDATNFKELTDTMFNVVTEKIKATGINFMYLDEKAHPDLGQYPREELGKGNSITSYEGKEFSRVDTEKFLAGADAVIFIRVRGKYNPRTVSTMNAETVINYDVRNQLDVRVCRAYNQCSTLIVPELTHEPDKDMILPVPESDYKVRDNFVANNTVALNVNAEVIAGVITQNLPKLISKK